MRQKITWTYFLLVGCSLILINGCKETIEYRINGNFIFKNETSHDVIYSYIASDYSDTLEILRIESNSQSVINAIAPGKKRVSLENCECENFFFDMIGKDYPIVFLFDESKCKSYDIGQSPTFNLSNYDAVQTDSDTFEFTYLISETMYTEAVNCE